MTSIKDIHWTAGFVEGEGTFYAQPRKNGGGMPVVCAGQNEKEPLEKLQRLYGGYLYSCKQYGNQKEHWLYRLNGGAAAGLAMTLYTLMGQRRRGQIREMLRKWHLVQDSGQWRRDLTHCKRGHEFTKVNTYRTPAGHRSCRICRRTQNRENYRRHKNS